MYNKMENVKAQTTKTQLELISFSLPGLAVLGLFLGVDAGDKKHATLE